MYKILRDPIEVRGNTEQPTIRCRNYEGTECRFLAECDDAAYQRIQAEAEQWQNGPSFQRHSGLILLGVCEKLFSCLAPHNFKIPVMLLRKEGKLCRPLCAMRNGAMYWVPVHASIDGAVLPWRAITDTLHVNREVYCEETTRRALLEIAEPTKAKVVGGQNWLLYEEPVPEAVEDWLQEHKLQREGHLYWFSWKEQRTIRLPQTIDLGVIPAEEGPYGFNTYKVTKKLGARLDELCTIRLDTPQ